MRSKIKNGFTLVELIIVMSIMGVLLGLVTIALSNVRQRTTINALTQIFVSDIRQQQIKAMSGDTQGGATADSYGIHVESSQYVLFKGTSYDPAASSNFTVDLPANMQFVVPAADVVFYKVSGDAVASYSDELVGYWNFNEGGTEQVVNDSSGYGNNGTRGANSSPGSDDPDWAPSKPSLGEALDFDGLDFPSGDFVNVSDNASLRVTNITMAAWINPDNVSGRTILARTDDIYRLAKVNDSTFRAKIFTSSTFTASGGSFTPGLWYYVVGTYDGETLRLYVNGVEVASNPSPSGPIFTGVGDLCIGAHNNQNNCIETTVGHFNGLIDEVRIYNRALSALEISYLYTGIPFQLIDSVIEFQLQDITNSMIKTIQLNRYGAVTSVN